MTKVNEQKLLRAAGRRGKTKAELAERLDAGYSTIAAVVNALVAEGKLQVVGEVKPETGRPAPRYAATA